MFVNHTFGQQKKDWLKVYHIKYIKIIGDGGRDRRTGRLASMYWSYMDKKTLRISDQCPLQRLGGHVS